MESSLKSHSLTTVYISFMLLVCVCVCVNVHFIGDQSEHTYLYNAGDFCV